MNAERQGMLAGWVGLSRSGLARGACVRLPVLTGSMAPLLAPGGWVWIRGATWRECRAGDVIVFRSAGALTAHRLLAYAWAGGCWRLFQKGDVNAVGGWIRADQVVGIVVAARDKDGRRWDLRSVEARRAGRRRAWRELLRDLRWRLPTAVRGAAWRLRPSHPNTASGSAARSSP